MPRDQVVIDLSDTEYTEITDAVAVSAITFQPIFGDIYIRYTEDATQPAPESGWVYERVLGEARRTPSDFTPWTGPSRVWAMAIEGRGSSDVDARVIVTHA